MGLPCAAPPVGRPGNGRVGIIHSVFTPKARCSLTLNGSRFSGEEDELGLLSVVGATRFYASPSASSPKALCLRCSAKPSLHVGVSNDLLIRMNQ